MIQGKHNQLSSTGTRRRQDSSIPSGEALTLSKKTILLLALIMSGSLVVRLYGLNKQSIDCEEFYTIPAATGHHYVYFGPQAEFKPSVSPVAIQEYRNL